jgi:hypothetical protein
LYIRDAEDWLEARLSQITIPGSSSDEDAK